MKSLFYINSDRWRQGNFKPIETTLQRSLLGRVNFLPWAYRVHACAYGTPTAENNHVQV